MKFLLLLSGWLAAGWPLAGRVTISPASVKTYAQAKKTALAKPRFQFSLKKGKGQIIIPTTKGSSVFRDVTAEQAFRKGRSEEAVETYTYLGYLPDFSCHAVGAFYYEIGSTIFITPAGKKVELWGDVAYSPDHRYIIGTCRGLEYGGGQPNRISIVEANQGQLWEVWRYDPKAWEPADPVWVSNTEVLLRQIHFNHLSGEVPDTYVVLKINR